MCSLIDLTGLFKMVCLKCIEKIVIVRVEIIFHLLFFVFEQLKGTFLLG